MTKGLFFDQDYYYEETPTDENTEWNLIRPVVWQCQKVYIEDIIGSVLYDLIEDEIVANDGPLTTPRLVTLCNEYIAPCLVYYTLMEAQVSLTFKIRNRSVQTQRGTDTDEVDFQTHKYLKAEYKTVAEKFAQKIERYLIANSTTFPEYTNYTTSDQVRAQNQRPTVSVYLPGLDSCQISKG